MSKQAVIVVMKHLKLIRDLCIGAALIALILLTISVVRKTPRDDSDPPGGMSGLTVYTDAFTGCQYLSRPSGNLTPRLYSDGVQVCKETK
jgi:hypothetical protein